MREHKIALLSDIHGNYEALKSVISHAEQSGVTEYWLLGDILLPGPGNQNILRLLDKLPITVKVRGNWDDCLLEAFDGLYSPETTDEIYLLRLAQYLEDKISTEQLDNIRQTPLSVRKTVNGLNFTISHNLPEKNWGGHLLATNDTVNFDDLFSDETDDIAIFGHIHHQLLRYSSDHRLIVNPGSIGQPYYQRERFRNDLRAQYAILTIDEQGYSEISFKKVLYHKSLELSYARESKLPFFEAYQELLNTGINKDKDREYLDKLIEQHGYLKEVIKWQRKTSD